MKRFRYLGVAILLALMAQGCATTKTVKVAKRKQPISPPSQRESYALVTDDFSLDSDIIRRGNKVRGLSEY